MRLGGLHSSVILASKLAEMTAFIRVDYIADIHHVLRYQIGQTNHTASLREFRSLTSRGIDKLWALGVCDANKHRDVRRDGEKAQSKQSGAGHFNNTWQSSVSDDCLGLAGSGFDRQALCSAEPHGCCDCDEKQPPSGSSICWWGCASLGGCAGGKRRSTQILPMSAFCNW